MNKKLFNDIVMSPLWHEQNPTRVVYITMIALSNQDDIVCATINSLAHVSNVSPRTCRVAINRLSSEDIHEAIRIKECDDGWIILNGDNNRKSISKDDRREYQKLKMREYRKEKKEVAEKSAKPKTAAVWGAYALAYALRYGVDPVRNARVNAQLSQFIDRVGAEEAPGIASYYVASGNFFYAAKGHPVGLLLMDCEKLRTEYVTGNQISITQARHLDKRLSTRNAFERLLGRVESDPNTTEGDL